jgi:hypothetical protein
MVVDADEEGLTVSVRSGDPSFDIEWDDVYAWEPSNRQANRPPPSCSGRRYGGCG